MSCWSALSEALKKNVVGRLDLMSRHSMKNVSHSDRCLTDSVEISIHRVRVSLKNEKYLIMVHEGIGKWFRVEIKKKDDGKTMILKSQSSWDPNDIVTKSSDFSPEETFIHIVCDLLAHDNVQINGMEWEIEGGDDCLEEDKKASHSEALSSTKRVLDSMKKYAKRDKLFRVKILSTSWKSFVELEELLTTYLVEKDFDYVERLSLCTSPKSLTPVYCLDSFAEMNGEPIRVSTINHGIDLPAYELLHWIATGTEYHATLRFAAIDKTAEDLWNSMGDKIEQVTEGLVMKKETVVKIGCPTINFYHQRSSCGYWIYAVPHGFMRDFMVFFGRFLYYFKEGTACGLGWLCQKHGHPFERHYYSNLGRRVFHEPDWADLQSQNPDPNCKIVETMVQGARLLYSEDEKIHGTKKGEELKSWGFRQDSESILLQKLSKISLESAESYKNVVGFIKICKSRSEDIPMESSWILADLKTVIERMQKILDSVRKYVELGDAEGIRISLAVLKETEKIMEKFLEGEGAMGDKEAPEEVQKSKNAQKPQKDVQKTPESIKKPNSKKGEENGATNDKEKENKVSEAPEDAQKSKNARKPQKNVQKTPENPQNPLESFKKLDFKEQEEEDSTNDKNVKKSNSEVKNSPKNAQKTQKDVQKAPETVKKQDFKKGEEKDSTNDKNDKKSNSEVKNAPKNAQKTQKDVQKAPETVKKQDFKKGEEEDSTNDKNGKKKDSDVKNVPKNAQKAPEDPQNLPESTKNQDFKKGEEENSMKDKNAKKSNSEVKNAPKNVQKPLKNVQKTPESIKKPNSKKGEEKDSTNDKNVKKSNSEVKNAPKSVQNAPEDPQETPESVKKTDSKKGEEKDSTNDNKDKKLNSNLKNAPKNVQKPLKSVQKTPESIKKPDFKKGEKKDSTNDENEEKKDSEAPEDLQKPKNDKNEEKSNSDVKNAPKNAQNAPEDVQKLVFKKQEDAHFMEDINQEKKDFEAPEDSQKLKNAKKSNSDVENAPESDPENPESILYRLLKYAAPKFAATYCKLHGYRQKIQLLHKKSTKTNGRMEAIIASIESVMAPLKAMVPQIMSDDQSSYDLLKGLEAMKEKAIELGVEEAEEVVPHQEFIMKIEKMDPGAAKSYCYIHKNQDLFWDLHFTFKCLIFEKEESGIEVEQDLYKMAHTYFEVYRMCSEVMARARGVVEWKGEEMEEAMEALKKAKEAVRGYNQIHKEVFPQRDYGDEEEEDSEEVTKNLDSEVSEDPKDSEGSQMDLDEVEENPISAIKEESTDSEGPKNDSGAKMSPKDVQEQSEDAKNDSGEVTKNPNSEVKKDSGDGKVDLGDLKDSEDATKNSEVAKNDSDDVTNPKNVKKVPEDITKHSKVMKNGKVAPKDPEAPEDIQEDSDDVKKNPISGVKEDSKDSEVSKLDSDDVTKSEEVKKAPEGPENDSKKNLIIINNTDPDDLIIEKIRKVDSEAAHAFEKIKEIREDQLTRSGKLKAILDSIFIQMNPELIAKTKKLIEQLQKDAKSLEPIMVETRRIMGSWNGEVNLAILVLMHVIKYIEEKFSPLISDEPEDILVAYKLSGFHPKYGKAYKDNCEDLAMVEEFLSLAMAFISTCVDNPEFRQHSKIMDKINNLIDNLPDIKNIHTVAKNCLTTISNQIDDCKSLEELDQFKNVQKMMMIKMKFNSSTRELIQEHVDLFNKSFYTLGINPKAIAIPEDLVIQRVFPKFKGLQKRRLIKKEKEFKPKLKADVHENYPRLVLAIHQYKEYLTMAKGLVHLAAKDPEFKKEQVITQLIPYKLKFINTISQFLAVAEQAISLIPGASDETIRALLRHDEAYSEENMRKIRQWRRLIEQVFVDNEVYPEEMEELDLEMVRKVFPGYMKVEPFKPRPPNQNLPIEQYDDYTKDPKYQLDPEDVEVVEKLNEKNEAVATMYTSTAKRLKLHEDYTEKLGIYMKLIMLDPNLPKTPDSAENVYELYHSLPYLDYKYEQEGDILKGIKWKLETFGVEEAVKCPEATQMLLLEMQRVMGLGNEEEKIYRFVKVMNTVLAGADGVLEVIKGEVKEEDIEKLFPDYIYEEDGFYKAMEPIIDPDQETDFYSKWLLKAIPISICLLYVLFHVMIALDVPKWLKKLSEEYN